MSYNTKARLEALLDAQPHQTVQQLRDALPDIPQRTVEWTLWHLVNTGAVLRSPGGAPRPGIAYTYALALGDDAWSPQPWRHPYARTGAAA